MMQIYISPVIQRLHVITVTSQLRQTAVWYTVAPAERQTFWEAVERQPFWEAVTAAAARCGGLSPQPLAPWVVSSALGAAGVALVRFGRAGGANHDFLRFGPRDVAGRVRVGVTRVGVGADSGQDAHALQSRRVLHGAGRRRRCLVCVRGHRLCGTQTEVTRAETEPTRKSGQHSQLTRTSQLTAWRAMNPRVAYAIKKRGY